MANPFIVSVSPHIKATSDVSKIMGVVFIALLPTAIAAVYLFGLQSLFVIVTSIVTCVLTEWGCNVIFKTGRTFTDGSAAVTGILLAFVLPPSTPLWMVAIGGFLAIFLVKQLFGGLGYNIFNPALAARAILLSSWPVAITTWMRPVNYFFTQYATTSASISKLDATTTASVLGVLKEAQRSGEVVASTYSYLDLFLGNIPGSLGETCKVTLLLGAALLLALEIIDWRIPVSYIGTVAVLSFLFGRDPLAAVLSGGLILGAFFMATDMVTSPTTNVGKLVFGTCCGIITALIRSYGGFPEGVCYSILFMNCLSPMIDKYIQPRVFGTTRNWFKKPTPAAEKAK